MASGMLCSTGKLPYLVLPAREEVECLVHVPAAWKATQLPNNSMQRTALRAAADAERSRKAIRRRGSWFGWVVKG